MSRLSSGVPATSPALLVSRSNLTSVTRGSWRDTHSYPPSVVPSSASSLPTHERLRRPLATYDHSPRCPPALRRVAVGHSHEVKPYRGGPTGTNNPLATGSN